MSKHLELAIQDYSAWFQVANPCQNKVGAVKSSTVAFWQLPSAAWCLLPRWRGMVLMAKAGNVPCRTSRNRCHACKTARRALFNHRAPWRALPLRRSIRWTSDTSHAHARVTVPAWLCRVIFLGNVGEWAAASHGAHIGILQAYPTSMSPFTSHGAQATSIMTSTRTFGRCTGGQRSMTMLPSWWTGSKTDPHLTVQVQTTGLTRYSGGLQS